MKFVIPPHTLFYFYMKIWNVEKSKSQVKVKRSLDTFEVIIIMSTSDKFINSTCTNVLEIKTYFTLFF